MSDEVDIYRKATFACRTPRVTVISNAKPPCKNLNELKGLPVYVTVFKKVGFI